MPGGRGRHGFTFLDPFPASLGPCVFLSGRPRNPADNRARQSAKAGLDRGRWQGWMRALDPAARICADPGMTDRNPLLAPWSTPFGVPPFAEIEPGHFVPAFAHAMAEHLAEIAAIGTDPAAPSFANTIEALQRSGRALTRVGSVFGNLVVSQGGAALEALDRELSPTLAQHGMRVALDAAVFRRVAALYEQHDSLGLEKDQLRLLERTHLGFIRSGAALPPAERISARWPCAISPPAGRWW